MPHPKETAAVFKGDTDVFTLAGFDDDWDSIDLRSSLIVGQEDCFPGDDELDCMSLDLDASSTGIPYHTSDLSDFSWHHHLGAALDHPVFDLDSDDDCDMGREEIVLDF